MIFYYTIMRRIFIYFLFFTHGDISDISNIVFEKDNFEKYIISDNKIMNASINMNQEIKEYLKFSESHKKLLLELEEKKWNQNPLIYFLPELSFTPDKNMSNIDFEWKLSPIWENFLSFIFSIEREQLLYKINEERNQGAIKTQEYFIQLARLINNIRTEYKIYLYLIKEWKEKKILEKILDEDNLNDLFILEEYIFDTIEKLYDYNNQLEEFIINNLGYFVREKINIIINFFHSPIGNEEIIPYKIKYHNVPDINYLAYMIKKPFFSPVLNIKNQNFQFGNLNQNQWNWNLNFLINPIDYINYFLRIYFQKEGNKIENQERKKRFLINKSIQKEEKSFREKQILILEKILYNIEKNLHNDKLISQITPKILWRTNIDYIRKKELIELLKILQKLQNLIIFE